MTQTNPDGTVFTQNGGRPVGPNPQPPYNSPSGNTNVGATLYNYGLGAGDTFLGRGDDNYALQSWVGTGPAGSSLSLPFYGNRYGGNYINTNGNVSFNGGVSAYTGQPFPSSSTPPMIAPFWADVDTRNPASGQVWYRTVQDTASLAAIATKVNGSFLGNPGFSPTFAQVVTWDHVGYYSTQADRLNTFQMVLASDGVRTFTLFLYPNQAIWWDRGGVSGNSFASVGFDAGDRINYYNAVGSGTSMTRDLWFLTNTVPADPGVQAFRIDGTTIIPSPTTNTGTINWTNPGPTQVVTSTLALPAATGTVVGTLQLSANAAGHTISSTAASGSLQFNNLIFDQPTDSVTFSGAGVYLTNAADAITQGYLVFTGTSALVARTAGAINGGNLTFQNNTKLHLWTADALTGNASLTFDNGSAGATGTGGTLDLRGLSTSVGALNSVGTAAGLITSSLTGASTLTLAGSGSGDFNGTLSNGSGTLTLVKSGSGSQILSGRSLYTGNTTVSGGTLQFAKTSAFYNSVVTATTAAKLSVSNGATAAFNVGGTGEFTAENLTTLLGSASFAGGTLGLDTTNTAGGTFTLADALGGTSGLTKLGTGALTLSGANSYTGATTISAGILTLGASNRLADTTALTVASGATFNLAGFSETVGSLAGVGSVTLGAGTLTSGGTNASTTFSGVLSGTGGLVKAGTGTLTLTAANTYSGATTINAGTVEISGAAGDTTLFQSGVTTGAIAVNNGGTLLLSRTNTFGDFLGTSTTPITINAGGLVTNTARFNTLVNLTLAGGTLEAKGGYDASFPAYQLKGTVTASGAAASQITAPGGANAFTQIQLGNNAAGGTTTFHVADAAGSLGIANALVDGRNASAAAVASGLTKTGTGTLTLSAANTYSGATTINAGTLEFAGTSGGTFLFQSGVTTGSITVNNGGTLLFSRNNTFGDYSVSSTGQMTINAGGLVTNGAYFNTLVNLTLAGGTLEAKGGVDASFPAYQLKGTVTASGAVASQITAPGGTNTFTQIQLGNNTAGGTTTFHVADAAGSLSIANALVDGRNSTGSATVASGLVKTGAGTLTLSAANTYSGATNINAGTLEFTGASGGTFLFQSGVTTGAVTVNNGGTLLFSRNNTFGDFSAASTAPITINAGGLVTNGARFNTLVNLTLAGGTLAATGGVDASFPAYQLKGTVTASGTVASQITAPGGTNAFTQIQLGNNTAGGTTTFHVADAAGSLSIANALVDGRNSAGSAAVASGLVKTGAGTLTLNGTNTYTGATTVSSGTLQMARPGSTSAFTIAGGAALELAPTVDITSGGSPVISGTGTLRKTGTTSLAWTTGAATFALGSGALIDVQSGTFVGSSNANEVWTNNLADLNVASGAFFNGVEGNIRVDVLAGSGTIRSGLAGAGYQNFTFGVDQGSGTFAGVLANTDGANLGNFVKTGSGTQILTGASTFTGSLTISGGTLQVGDGGTTGSLATTAIINNTALTFNRSNALTYAGIISGTGSLTQAGAGTLTLSGANTYTGATTVSAGTLALGAANRLADTTAVSVASAATFNLAGFSETVGSLAGAGNITLGSGTLTAGGDNTSTTFSGIASGTGGVTKSGTGTFTLSGANTYTGATTVSSGTLALGAANRLADTTAVTVAAGATFNLAGYSETVGSLAGAGNVTLGAGALTVGGDNTSTTWAGVASGTGGVTKSGAGTFTLSGANSYSGATTVSAGALQIGSGGTTGSITGNIVNNAALTFKRSNALTYAGVISGSGSLTQAGAGTLTLTSASTFTGGTTLAAGTLLANNVSGSALGSGAVTVNSGATLGGGGFIGGLTTFNSGAHLAPGNSPGTLTFNAGLVLQSGSILDFQLGTASDQIVLAGGALTGPGTVGGVTLNLSNSGGFTAGTYTLINYTSALASSGYAADSFALGSTISGYTYNLALSGNSLQLTATASAIPEPSTYAALAGLAALGLTLLRKRRLR